ncbi:WD40 repeat domain-containing protein [Schinkia sp. CFF1]
MYKKWWALLCVIPLLLTSCQLKQYEKIDVNTSQVIVVNLMDKSLSFFDEKTKKETAKWFMPYTFTGATLLPDQKTILLYGKHLKKIYLYDVTTGREVDRWKLGVGIVNVQISNDRSKLYLADQESDTIQVRTLAGKKLKEIPVGHAPQTILESNKRKELYVLNFRDSLISVIDSRTFKNKKAIEAKPAAVGAVLIESSGELWTGGHGAGHMAENAVTVYSVDTGEMKQEIKAPIMPVDLEKLDNYIYVVSHGSNQLRKIDVNTKKVIETLEIGANPFEISIINNLIYSASYDSNEVIVVDPLQMKIVDTLKAGKGPFQILYKRGVKHE